MKASTQARSAGVKSDLALRRDARRSAERSLLRGLSRRLAFWRVGARSTSGSALPSAASVKWLGMSGRYRSAGRLASTIAASLSMVSRSSISRRNLSFMPYAALFRAPPGSATASRGPGRGSSRRPASTDALAAEVLEHSRSSRRQSDRTHGRVQARGVEVDVRGASSPRIDFPTSIVGYRQRRRTGFDPVSLAAERIARQRPAARDCPA